MPRLRVMSLSELDSRTEQMLRKQQQAVERERLDLLDRQQQLEKALKRAKLERECPDGFWPRPHYPLRDLTEDEAVRYREYGYVKFEAYDPPDGSVIGRFWTQEQLEKAGCEMSDGVECPVCV